MATVKSLGLHQPAGLQHAIAEQLLPAEPSSSAYAWDVDTDESDECHIEDELLTVKSSVIWSRGGVFRKTFNFDLEKEPITQALLARFPISDDDRGESATTGKHDNLQEPRCENALVVFLRTQAHIYFLSGTSHVLHMPFEVESAFAGPVGILMQRKQTSDHDAAVALKFPRVAPDSFVSSHPAAFDSSQRTTFSIEGLGQPKSLQFGLGSTLEHMWEAPLVNPESRWPRIVSLTDPLSRIGFVVTDSEHHGARNGQTFGKNSLLDAAEELLHLEQLHFPGVSTADLQDPVVLVVTVNRETSCYSIWRLTYLSHEDPFIQHHKPKANKPSRRRSSMQPGLASASGTATPVPASLRESFGAPLPGKRPRKNEKMDKPLDLVTSLEQEDKKNQHNARRSSRRVSSMLARADLSASHERPSFSEHTPGPSQTSFSRRPESLGGHHQRLSSNYNQHVRASLGSLLEAPLDFGLDEDLNKMGIEDHELEEGQHDAFLSRIHAEPVNSSNVRYSTSGKPAREQSKVFVLSAPAFATGEYHRSQLLVGIQDPAEKRLQLITLHVKMQQRLDPMNKAGQRQARDDKTISIIPGEVRKAQNVVDSCKVTDGPYSSVLILSESMDGQHELSMQAPWSEMVKVSLTYFSADNTRSLQYRGRTLDRDVRQKKVELMDLSRGSIVGFRNSRKGGAVDLVDAEGRLHQLRLHLRPTCPQVAKILSVCESILPECAGHRISVGWVHVMQWLQAKDEPASHMEWSAATIVLLSLFLNLGRVESQGFETAQLPIRKRRHVSGSFVSIKDSHDWRALEAGESENSLGCPVWMSNRGWAWSLDEDASDASPSHNDQILAPKFLTKHIAMAKEFISSPMGVTAFGSQGYMPTALGRGSESRRKVAVDVLVGLHLLLEEQKLDIMTPEYASPGRTDLRVILSQITRWLNWHAFSEIYELGVQEDLDPKHDADLSLNQAIPQPPVTPDVFEWVQSRLAGTRGAHYLTLADIFYASSRLPESEKRHDHRWDALMPRTLMFKQFFKVVKAESTAVQMVQAMYDCGITKHVLETLPEAILIPLQDAITMCQPRPPTTWSKDLLDFIKRSDISLVLDARKRSARPTTHLVTPTHHATWDFKLLCQSVDDANGVGYDEGEGTERQAVIRVLHRDDRRLNEAQNLLSTHRARIVRMNHDPSWPESEYLEKQKELVTRIANGTLAIPAGRGLLYYSLRYPLITQKFHIGGFNLNCIVRPSNTTVGVDKSLFSEEKVCWGFFHQGVAAGLSISPEAKGIDTSWILYNKPGQDLSNRHAGFLLALGLNGHLKGVAKWVAFKYLTPKHTMTSIGLLLGLAASYMGTMDSLITRLLSVHATRMLPRGAAELNLSHLTQTSGIMGIGLLYCNSQHRRMSEVMLSEIEHVDEEDEEEPLRSECYRLAAGFSLGLINLGKGNDLKGLHDMKLTEKLVAHATATKNVDIVHVLDRAAAGAVMAVALIFMKTEDQIVARKIDIPESILQFDYVRPDILLLRTVAKNIILWSKIEPTFAWIHQSLPSAYRAKHKLQNIMQLKSTDLPFFSILAGVCFSIGLRFAGSASTKVRDLLLHYLDQLMRICRIPPTPRTHPDAAPPYDEELARTQARMCQDIVALSVSIVMAGTGDIPVLRRLRALHGREDPDTPYGSHLAAHLAIGALFLGCGTATFGSSNLAIAALLISFYPIFPTNVMDNKSHLQALRHFWVLATEQRCLVAKDVQTGQPISVPVQITMHNTASYDGVLHRTTPCLLPPLDQISSLSTACGPQYWDVQLDFSNRKLRETFSKTQDLYLRRRPPREGAFSSTLTALGDSKREDPLAWVFELGGLQGISYAERVSVLDAAEEELEVGAAVDAKLEMDRGIAEGGDRERLQGAKLLFEWGAARERLVKNEARYGSGDTAAKKQQGKAVAEGQRQERESDSTAPTDDTAWWMRDSAIEALKGRVWLAAREGEP